MIGFSDTNLAWGNSLYQSTTAIHWGNSIGQTTYVEQSAYVQGWVRIEWSPSKPPPVRLSPSLRRLLERVAGYEDAVRDFEAGLRRRPTIDPELRAPAYAAPRERPRFSPATLRPLPLLWPVAIAAYRGRSRSPRRTRPVKLDSRAIG